MAVEKMLTTDGLLVDFPSFEVLRSSLLKRFGVVEILLTTDGLVEGFPSGDSRPGMSEAFEHCLDFCLDFAGEAAGLLEWRVLLDVIVALDLKRKTLKESEE